MKATRACSYKLLVPLGMATISESFLKTSWMKLWILAGGFMLCFAQLPPPPAPPMPSMDDQSVSVVATGKELADALANPLKSFALLSSSIQVTDADFPATVIARTTNFTISGMPGPQTSWPVLDLGFIKGKIRLDNNSTTLILQYLTVHDFRAMPLGQSPGVDIVASSLTEAGALVVVQDAVLMLRICVPRTIQGEIMTSIARPANLPGTQVVFSNVSQPGCINTTSNTVPAVSRCWPDRGIFAAVAVAGYDIDAFGRATATRYSLYMLRAPYLCQRQMTEECVSQLGPLGCYLYMFPRTSMPPLVAVTTTGPSTSPPLGSTPPQLQLVRFPPGLGTFTSGPPTPPSTNLAGAPADRKSLTAVVAGVVAGVVAVGIAVLATVLVVQLRWRRAEARKAVYEESKKQALQAPQTKGDGGTGDTGGTASGNSNTGVKLAPCKGPSPPHSQEAPTSGPNILQKPSSSTTTTNSMQLPASSGRRIILPSGIGTCVLSNVEVDSSSPLVIVTPFTPHRSDLKLDVQCDTEVKLLPIIRGKGSYGRVVEGLYGGQRVAVKLVVDVDEWSGPTESLVSSFAQEVEVLGRCQHPNVVRLLAACLKLPRLCLVMELMDTSLERLVHSKSGELLPLPTVLHIAADISRGLAYLHPTIVHRDLKPGNVLLSNTDTPRPIAKLTDFGLSRLRSTVLVTRHPEAGTPAYMAPEAFDASNYVITHKADIYALGVILWEMLTGSIPWDGCSMVAIAYSITVRHHRLPLSKLDAIRCPPKLRKLIHQCWDPDPQRRPAAAELVKQLTLVLQLGQGENEGPSSNGSLRSAVNANTDVLRGPQSSKLVSMGDSGHQNAVVTKPVSVEDGSQHASGSGADARVGCALNGWREDMKVGGGGGTSEPSASASSAGPPVTTVASLHSSEIAGNLVAAGVKQQQT